MATTNNISNPKPTEVLEAKHQCKFLLFNTDDSNYQGESNFAFGYCVLDAQGQEYYYVAIEQDSGSDDLLTVYPPSYPVGATTFISFEGSRVECWSLKQFCLASNSFASIYPRRLRPTPLNLSNAGKL